MWKRPFFHKEAFFTPTKSVSYSYLASVLHRRQMVESGSIKRNAAVIHFFFERYEPLRAGNKKSGKDDSLV